MKLFVTINDDIRAKVPIDAARVLVASLIALVTGDAAKAPWEENVGV